MREGWVHNDLLCKVPLSEHEGHEPCITWTEEKKDEPIPVTIYKQGVQGNMVADYYAEHLARYGPPPSGPIGSPEISDKRDNRDPEEVGRAILLERENLRHRNGSQEGHPERNGHAV